MRIVCDTTRRFTVKTARHANVMPDAIHAPDLDRLVKIRLLATPHYLPETTHLPARVHKVILDK